MEPERRARRLPWLVLLSVAAVVATAPPSAVAGPHDPPFDVPRADLRKALDCGRFVHPEHEPVLLVHGTFTNGHEEYDWNYQPFLRHRGFDVCVVTYPDRGLGDLQVSAEYVAFAVEAIHRMTGRKVDMIGHSQGGLMPRWAIKYWPSVQAEVDDFVMLAAPNHGTTTARRPPPGGKEPASGWQMAPGSMFLTALNAGDETPGDVSYSSIYSRFHDELVQPDGPVPTAALDWGHEGPNTRNLAVQDRCPGRFVDHLAIGTVDLATAELVVDALTHPGPVDPRRVPDSACREGLMAGQPGQVRGIVSAWEYSRSRGFPRWHMRSSEPPLRPYARG